MSLNILNRGATDTNDNSTMQVREMDPKVYQKRANFAFFVTFLRLLQMRRTSKRSNRSGMSYGNKLKNVENPKFEWANTDIGTPTDTVNGAINSSATSLVVDNGTTFTAGDVIMNLTTKERMLVTAVSTNTLTVVRGWGSSDALAAPSAAAVADGATIAILGNAFEENDDAPSAMSFSTEEFYNYTEIFRRVTGSSNTELATKYYGDVNTMNFKKQMLWDLFLRDRAASYYRGVRNKLTTGTHPIRTQAGLEQWITTNVHELTGGMDYNDFLDFTEDVMAYGGDEKMIVANPAMMTLIQKEVIGNPNVQLPLSPKAKEFGVAIKQLTTVHGTFDFAVDRTLGDIYPSTMAVAYCLEFGLLEEMILRPDKWKENIQDNDVDGRLDEVIGECGLKVVNEERHGIITVDLS